MSSFGGAPTGVEPLSELTRRLQDRETTSSEVLRRCREFVDDRDQVHRAFIGLDPDADAHGAQSDLRLENGASLSVLEGVPVAIKDSIDTAGLLSTSGSRLLQGVPPRRDADFVRLLRQRGMVVLGKTNLSEWSGSRSPRMIEGWSTVGGQTRHAQDPRRSPWGSSAGSAVAVATGMAPLAIGTETDGSVVGPAGQNGVVGVKFGLEDVTLCGIAGISSRQDTVGLFGATVECCTTALRGLFGAGTKGTGRLAPVRQSRRVALWYPVNTSSGVRRAIDERLDQLNRRLEVRRSSILDVQTRLWPHEARLLRIELPSHLETYLRHRDDDRSLGDLIEANRRDPAALRLFGQESFESSRDARPRRRDHLDRTALTVAARAAIRSTLAVTGADLILAPSNAPAWLLDESLGDPILPTSSTPAALAGYPSVSIPFAIVGGLPVGLTIFGPGGLRELWQQVRRFSSLTCANRQ